MGKGKYVSKHSRNGQVRRALLDAGVMDDLILGNVTQTHVAKELGVHQTSVSQAIKAERELRDVAAERRR